MKRVVKKSFLLLMLCLLILLLVNFVSADIFINEFMPNSLDTHHEWIELYNNGTSSINLNSWNISEEGASQNYTLGATSIPADGFVVLVRNETIFNQTYNITEAALIEYGPTVPSLNLNDGGDSVFLYNSSGDLYDSILKYGDPGENVSIGRYPDGNSNTYNLSVTTPGAKNDREAPVFNKWLSPSANNSYIAGLYNITVNITDLAYSVNVSIFEINSSENYTMNMSGDLFYYIWNTTAYGEQPFNLTVYFNDSLGFSGTDSLLDITIDNTFPNITSGNLTGVNSRNFIFPGAKFNETVNVTDNYGIKNATCYLNGTLVGYHQNLTDVYYCELTAPTAEDDYTITFTAYDLANNSNTTTTSFTTKYSTSANLTTQDIAVSGLNQSDKIVEVNITFNNKGSNIIYSPKIILDSFSTSFAQATDNANKTCAANLSTCQSCSASFNVTIFGGRSAGDYTIFWNANWTDNNLSSNELAQAARSYVTINSNPQITSTENRSATITHNTNQTITISINSTGNAVLQNVNIVFSPITLQSSWVNITPSDFSSISAASNETFNVTVTVPKYTSPGNYTGNLTITATGTETKSILLTVEVPQDSSWTTYPSTTTTYKKTSSAGLLATIYINNSGNIGQLYNIVPSGSLYFYIWNNSNPSSQYVEKGTTQAVNFYHLANGPLDSYTATLTITSYNTSEVNSTSFNLTRDDASPVVNITSPLNNSYPKGVVDFNVSASDFNLSYISFYINNNLVFNDVNLTKTFSWNTTDGSYSDNTYILKAEAYDTAGNFNLSEINVTVNNSDNAPVLMANIPSITWNEENITNLTLSSYFKTIDGDSLVYNFTPVNNITIHVNNATQVANFTPQANFSGTRYVIFYAADSSSNVTASNNVTLTVTNVNDLPTIPSLSYPSNNAIVYSAIGQLTLNWSTIDVDGDTITSYLYFANSTNLTLLATTTNNYYSLTSLTNNSKYYWRVNACDATNCSGNSSSYSFNITFDSAPVINSYLPSSLTPSVAENSSLFFSVNATDPDGASLNYTWKLGGTINKTNGNNFTYYPGFNASGTQTVIVNITDNNSNIVTNTWTVTVTDTNRAPALAAISNQTVNEDSTLLFNITATDSDLDHGDTLTYSSNLSTLTVTKINNTLAIANWTPTNSYVGNNSINFTVTDGTSTDSKTIMITVANINDAPVLATIGALTASQDSVFYYDVNATDVDTGDTLIFSDNSTLFTINSSSGEFNFTPTNAQIGSYIINFTVKDNSNETDTEIVNLTVANVNDPPVLDFISSKTVAEDSLLTFNVTASDPDNDTALIGSNSSVFTITMASNLSQATFSWTPSNSYVGNNTINFSVTDVGGLKDHQIVYILVTNTNDAPDITSYYPTNLNPRIAASTGSQIFNVTPSDPDTGDTTSTTWLRDNVQVGTGNSYTVSSLTAGQYNVTAKVNDTSGASATQNWTLNVTTNIISTQYTGSILGHNTTEENASDITINESTYGSIGFLATVNLSNAANIDDYINISWGIVAIDTSTIDGMNRAASVILKGLNYTKAPLIYYSSTFEATSGGSICNPSTTPSCTNITYDVANGILKFNVEGFSTYYTGTNTTNGAPTITSTAKVNATAGEAYSYDVDATDPDGDILTYSLTTSPTGMSISSSTGAISWTPTSSQMGMHNITVQVSDGNLTDSQSYNISVSAARRLRIKDLDVKIDSKSDKGVADGDLIKREAEPESNIEFKVEVESGFLDEDDMKIEDIVVEITIRDIDDGDDIDEESKEFDLRPERDKKVTLDFKVPLEVDEDTYDVDIHVEGDDENGTRYEVDWTVYLEVEKNKHDIKIIKASLSPAVVKCQKTTTLNTEIINLGREDEDEVVLEITSSDLVDFRKDNIELEEGVDDSRYSKSLSISIPDDLKIGAYPIEILTYYDTTRLSDTETVNLEIQECKEVKKQEEPAKTKPTVIVNKTYPKPTIIPQETTKITFRESPAYIAFLGLSFVILTGLLVFVILMLIVLLKK